MEKADELFHQLLARRLPHNLYFGSKLGDLKKTKHTEKKLRKILFSIDSGARVHHIPGLVEGRRATASQSA